MSIFVVIFSLVTARIIPPLLFKSINPLYMLPTYIKVLIVTYFSLIISVDILDSYLMGKTFIFNEISLAIALSFEFSIGVAFWFSLVLTYGALMTMFQFLDMQVGFNPTGIFNPAMSQSEPILSRSLLVFTLLLFFILDIHHLVIYIMSSTFHYYPILMEYKVVNIYELIGFFSSQLILSFLLVAPVVISVFWVEVMLGLCSRMMPQVNIYFVGLPAKVLVSILTLGFISSHAETMVRKIFSANFSYWDSLY
ncbi:flagellar biosynthetic protein FliR [Vibrio lentus]|uniref:flagellar biosynthetic protein FliR n=1 Tax=Vibrio TaxID=662 RepID=UPI000C8420F6|nr:MULTISPECIES: flagellar biosynthetic protein FliR [Vibrio]WGS63051.1 flagellar biosynthetic protein FliR [Vibrio lentus]